MYIYIYINNLRLFKLFGNSPRSFKRSLLSSETSCPQKSCADGTCSNALPTGLHWLTSTSRRLQIHLATFSRPRVLSSTLQP